MWGVGLRGDLVALVGEVVVEDLEDIGIVLDNEDPWRVHGVRVTAPAAAEIPIPGFLAGSSRGYCGHIEPKIPAGSEPSFRAGLPQEIG